MLDGLGMSARVGGWRVEAAATWNRLMPPVHSGEQGEAEAEAPRRDGIA